jgi:hypothetical protein
MFSLGGLSGGKAASERGVMAKTKKPAVRRKAKSAALPAEPAPLAPDERTMPAADERVLASNLALHELFAQQTARMLDRADLSEEQKQSILIGMSCPCCGAGGFSFTAKLKR